MASRGATAAQLQPEKGVAYFLEAAARVVQISPHIDFLVIGDGPLRHELQAYAKRLGIHKHVHFLGFRLDARALIGLLDILVIPSLLGTHISHLYGRYGWVAIVQDLVRAVLPPTILGTVRISPFQDQDLPAVMRLYQAANAERTGTFMRSLTYWQEQRTWLHEDLQSFLVAHDYATDVPVGYVRNRVAQDTVEVLELGIEGENLDIGRTLLSAIAMQSDGHLQGQFPPSLLNLFLPGEFGIIPEHGLMGRVINLVELVHALEALWLERVHEAGMPEGSLKVSTSAGHAAIRVSNTAIQVDQLHDAETVPPLNEGEFAHLLFHGFDERARTLIGQRPDASFLQILFPAQDFVIWQADVF